MKKIFLFLVLLSITPHAFALTIAEPSILAPMQDIHQKVEKGTFSLDIAYPSFGIKGIDSVIYTYIDSTRTDYLKSAKELFAQKEPDFTPTTSINISYKVLNDVDDIVSIEFQGYTYLWGAHGTPFINTFTFRKSTGNLITLTNQAHINKITSLIRPTLFKYLESIQMTDEKWENDGTAPTAENYQSFTYQMDSNGKLESITLYFQPYQVAAYAAGMPNVTIHKTGVVEVNN